MDGLETAVKEFKQVVEQYEEDYQEKGRMALLNMMHTKCVELRSVLNNQGNDVNLESEGDNVASSHEKEVSVNSEYYFHKFSPLKPDIKIEIKCPFCCTLFSSSRGFVNHVKKVHLEHMKSESVQASMSSLQNAEKGTCRLPSKDGSGRECGIRVTTDQYKKHFKVHYCKLRLLFYSFSF